jgi:hypothetical protein
MAKLKNLIIVFTPLIMASCAPEIMQVKMRVLQSETIQVIPKPTLMDLEIKEKKVKSEATGSILKSTVDGLKEKALYEAIKTSGADILVEPHYEIVKEGGKITVTVTGFPATIKSFRPVADSELPLLNMNDKLVAKYYPVIKLPTKR